jgi:ribosome assembly protein 4
VIFTNDHAKRFEDFKDTDFSQKDDNLGIKYENNEIFEDTVLLLRYNCPDTDCDVACLGWPDLHRHVKSKHGRVMWYVTVIYPLLRSITHGFSSQ